MACGFSVLVRSVRIATCELSCRNTFKRIGLALSNYDSAYGSLPPAVTRASNGKPMHSWRSLILNYLVAMPQIYEKDDAWDGPKNVRLINGHIFQFEEPAENTKDIGPYVGPLDFAQWFRCCAHRSNFEYSANVVAIVGHETLWPSNKGRGLTRVPDGKSITILLAETKEPDIYWSEPRDLVFDDMAFEVNSTRKPSISSHHPTGPLIVMADCSTYRLSPKTPANVVRALATCDGGEDYTLKALLSADYLIPDR